MTIQAQDPFRTRDHVRDFDEIVTALKERSALTRNQLRYKTVSYGFSPNETLDLFFPDDVSTSAPVHIFLHGGYWRMFSKDDYSYVADTVTSAGAIAVVVDYALMPGVRMATLVDQVRAAAGWVERDIAAFGGDPTAISVSGHSAGAQLACCLLDEPGKPMGFGIKSAFLLGGIYDLAPLQKSFLQTEIHLTDDEVREWSPLKRPFARGPNCAILVGEQETLPFHEQALSFHNHLVHHGVQSSLTTLPGLNHMTSVLDLGAKASVAGELLTMQIRQSRLHRSS